MSHEDFDLESLAKYLHLSPAQVARLAERGQIPARRIGGQWRFSAADVHHWLEDRIGVADDADLSKVEGVLDRVSQAAGDEAVQIARLLPEAAIAWPLQARTRGSVITEMCDLAAHTGWLWDAEQMADAVRARESLHPTALDNGVALLHPRRPLTSILAESFIALGRTTSGIPFGGSRGTLTDIFLLICSFDDRSHLRILARVSRLIAAPGLLDSLRAASDRRAAWQCLADRDAQL